MKAAKSKLLHSALACGLALLALGSGEAHAARPKTVKLTVKGARPVLAALMNVTEKYGYVVTFEDVILRYAKEFQDIELTRGEKHDPRKPRYLVAKVRSLTPATKWIRQAARPTRAR